jgi:peroxin-11B
MKVLQWPPATMLAINDLAPRLWLTGLIASFLYCCHQADAIVRENIQNSQHQNKSTYDIVRELFSANMRLRKLVYDMVQDVLDMSIPASQAGIVDLSAGTVGLCGTITSLMGLWTSWQGP